jgi:hypothetical protein
VSGRYDVIEFPEGWRVIERTNNGDKIHQKKHKTEADARARAHHLTQQGLLMNATANVRKRCKDRCECLGECDRGHLARCSSRRGEAWRVRGGAAVVLTVVALNHNAADLREENLRAYCQLCKAYYDAETEGAEPLFTMAEIGGPDGS